jgi:hypothetical protein
MLMVVVEQGYKADAVSDAVDVTVDRDVTSPTTARNKILKYNNPGFVS